MTANATKDTGEPAVRRRSPMKKVGGPCYRNSFCYVLKKQINKSMLTYDIYARVCFQKTTNEQDFTNWDSRNSLLLLRNSLLQLSIIHVVLKAL